MKRVLLTGMSGTGKSALVQALAARAYRAVDLDTDMWSHWVPLGGVTDPPASASGPESVWEYQDWVWREDRVEQLLAEDGSGTLFVSGTAANQGQFHPRFDHIVLLSAPDAVIRARLAARATNAYGKHPHELDRVMEHVRTVEPLLRRAASLEVDTSGPLDRVLDTILNAVNG